MFFLPFLTTIQTHYHSKNKVIVYFITYIIPEFLIVFLQNYPQGVADWGFYLVFVLSFISFVNLYETGYIYNETETIKKEKDPTKRLTNEQLAFYERHKYLIYSERLLLSFILNFCLSFFISCKSLILFSLEECLCMAVFFLYNSVRGGRITQFIYLFLSILKYSAPVFCFSERINFSVILACIFVFPLVRTLEYKAHYGEESNVNRFFRKYVIKYDVKKITVFRVWATMILLAISVALMYFGMCNILPVFLCAYMFIYRFLLWLAVKMGANFKGYLKR